MQLTIRAAAASATVLATCADAADIRVPQDFATIQAAVDAANDGDRVLVAPGTYEPFTFRAKQITVEGTGGAGATIIDASSMQVSAVAFEAGTGFDTVLRGFRVLTGAGFPGNNVGGGCSLVGDTNGGTPSYGTIEDCVFVGATGGCAYGGGVTSSGGGVAIRRCIFDATSAAHFGGAIFITESNPGQSAPGSGGCQSVVEDCVIHGTSSFNNGGIWLSSSSGSDPFKLLVTRTQFIDNHGTYVGAILLWGPTRGPGRVIVDSCTFQGNAGSLSNSIGCGLYSQGDGSGWTLSVRNCLFQEPGTALRCDAGSQMDISTSSFCSGSSAIASAYADGGGNSFTCDLSSDCDGDGVADLIATTIGAVADRNGDRIPDSCQCPADLTRDGQVNGADIGAVVAFWGPNPAFPAADVNGDGTVNGSDLATVLASWGPCGG